MFILEQEYYLRAQDVDIKGEWMPSAIFVRMQEIAEDHAALVGKGREQLIDEIGCGWVLTRMYVEMDRYPRLGEKIIVSTWPLKPTKLIFRRQFKFCNEEGEELGRASSQWVLFDIAERLLRRTDVIGEYPYDSDLQQNIKEPGKLALPEGIKCVGFREVQYSEVDMYKHMNNTKYLNWICELFTIEELQSKRIKSIKINYILEAYIGQRVDLYICDEQNGRYVCGKTEEKTVFDAFVCMV